MISRLSHLLLFAFGLVGAALWMHCIEPTQFLGWIRHKIDHVTRHGEQYDTVFLGSSRMYFGLSPDEFDTRMRELGQPTRSFNLALSGHRQHDIGAMVSWLMDHKPSSLRRVVIELHSFDQNVRAGDWMSDQELEMHVAGEFMGRCRSILLSPAAWPDKLLQFRFVVAHTLTNVLRVGQAPRIIDDWIAAQRREPLPGSWVPKQEGWRPIEEVANSFPHMLADHERFVSDPDAAFGVVAQRIVNIAPPGLCGGFNRSSIRSLVATVRARGMEPVFVVMPTFSQDLRGRDGVLEFSREARVLELDRPDVHRPLFDPNLYFDASHINASGAIVFSRYLADMLVECEGREFGFSPRPRLLPDSPLQLTATRTAEGVRCQAKNLPFVGELAVIGSPSAADAMVNGLRVRVEFPPRWSCELVRSSLLQATGLLRATDLPRDESIYLQLGVIVEGATIALGDLVRVEPR